MNYSDMLYRNSPEYQRAYIEGFEDCKRQVEELLRKLNKIQPYSETTGTTEVY